MAGCAINRFRYADCERIRGERWDTLVCRDSSVKSHCLRQNLRYRGNWDNGTPISKDGPEPPACYQWTKGGRKGHIIIGRSYLLALDHETCHAESERGLVELGWSPEAVAAANAKCERERPARWKNWKGER